MSSVSGRKILVTGGAGFIGSHTVDALLQDGARVVIVDELSTGRRDNLNPNAKFYQINVADEGLEKILESEQPEIIYHLAFHVLIPKAIENPLVEMDGIVGSVRMLHKAKEIGVKKIVFASSGFLYGNTQNLPATEEHPIDPVSPYVVSKHAVENYLRFYNRAYGMGCVILRYAAIYGPRQVTGAMADYIRRLSSGGQAEIWGDGTKTRDYVFIDDVVNANLLALCIAGNHPDPVFNIGTGTETTLNSLYYKIAKLLNVEAKPIYRPDRPGEQIRYCLDNTKVWRELGWRPRYSIDEGLERTVSAHLMNQSSYTD